MAKGSELLKFNQVIEDQEEVLRDAEMYNEGEAADMLLIGKALDAIQRSMMLYSD